MKQIRKVFAGGIIILSLLLLSSTNAMAQSTTSRGTKEMLETQYFYFDNPDGTIEAYPEYAVKELKGRTMSISSSKYATPLKGKPEGALKKYELLFNLMFARQTRTTVFVFDGQESAQAAAMATANYSSTLIGIWAAAEEAMREQVGKALDEAHIAHTTSATWKDALKQGKPEELMFNGHEGGHIVNRLDLSKSWLSLFAGANIEMVFDMYFYYDKEYDKIVGVVFSYSESKDPVGKYSAAAYGAIKAISAATGYYDPTTKQTTLASMFDRRDMIEYFKKHFHLKKTAPKCIAQFTGTPEKPELDMCGEKIKIEIIKIISNPPPGFPIDSTNIGEPPPPQKPEVHATRSTKKFAVIDHRFKNESIDQPFAENDKYVYFLQPSHEDNAVLAVDKQSGTITEAIPGKRKGDRPSIYSIGARGNDLFLDVEGLGLVRYDGKDVKTSQVIGEVDRGFMSSYKKIELSPNGRYLAYSGQNCTSYVYDLQSGNKLIKRFHDGCEHFLVTDDGDFFGINNFRAFVYRNNGNSDGDATNYVEIGELFKNKPAALRQINNEVYVAGGNKVMKTAVNEFKWTEATTLTGVGIELKDADIATDHSGFSVISDRSLNRFAHFATNSTTPKVMKSLSTGINVGRPKPLTVEIASNIHIDSNGNIWMVENTGTYFVVIYNPKGIVGLKNLAGKFVKQKK